MIAALYVDERGVYSGALAREFAIDLWGIYRDARTFAGTEPVIAHPPCKRWGRYWSGGPNPAAPRQHKGDDGGCFAHALWAVRTFGGVLEHPEASHAWKWFGLRRPDPRGGWGVCDDFGGWTCQVEQGHYGHHARKKTWLYAVSKTGFLQDNVYIPQIQWGPSDVKGRLEPGYHSAAEAKAARAAPGYRPARRPTQKQNEATPYEFALLLCQIARTCGR